MLYLRDQLFSDILTAVRRIYRQPVHQPFQLSWVPRTVPIIDRLLPPPGDYYGVSRPARRFSRSCLYHSVDRERRPGPQGDNAS
jgi:hypothetical protein